MSLAQIAQEALALSASERRPLIAQLVAADTEQNLDLKTSLTTKIVDRRAENWVTIDESKKSGSLASEGPSNKRR